MSKTRTLLSRTIAAALLVGLAAPAFAGPRDGDDCRRKNAEQCETRAVRQAAQPQSSQRPAEPGRRNETFAPTRPDPRALEIRQREQAQARNAERQQAQQRMVEERQSAERERRQQAQARQRADQDRMQARRYEAQQRADQQRMQAQREHDRAIDTRRDEQRRSVMAQQQEAARRAADARQRGELEQREQRAHFDDQARQRDRMRLSEMERQRRIAEQRAQAEQYRRYIEARQAAERQRTYALQQQRRMQQYRYQQWYWQRQRELQSQWNARNYSYNNDPYYYTPANYQYSRDGRYYQVNQYAADLLRQAVRYGYEEGVRAGRADRLDGWRSDYRDNYAYLDANFGYNGYYVGRDEYEYYFRQGFRRGYEDGYGRDYRYGAYNDGSYSILITVLNAILGLQPYG